MADSDWKKHMNVGEHGMKKSGGTAKTFKLGKKGGRGRGTLMKVIGKFRKSIKKRTIKRPKSIRNMYKHFSVIPRYKKTRGLNLMNKYLPAAVKR